MPLSSFLNNLNNLNDWSGCSNVGFFNVETGYASFRTRWLSECDCSIGQRNSLQYECLKCQKNAANNISVPSGDGDGLYSVVTFINRKGETFASATMFDTDSKLAKTMIDEIQNGSIRNFDSLQYLFLNDYHGIYLGELELENGFIFASDSSAGMNSPMATVWSDNWVSGGVSVYALVESSLNSGNVQAALALGASPEDFTGGLEDSIRIRMIILISDAYKKLQNGLGDIQYDSKAWQDQIAAWQKQQVVGHVGSANEVAIIWNGRLENCFATFAQQNNLGTEMDYLFKEFTWYLQGSLFGSQECTQLRLQMVEESGGELNEKDLLKSAYTLRGQMEKASELENSK